MKFPKPRVPTVPKQRHGFFITSAAGLISRQNDANTELRVDEIAGGRGTERLFNNLSFSIGPGELVWLRGQNGSGKTTLLRLVTGLGEPESGSITWNGEAVRNSTMYRNALVYLGHHNGLKDDLTALESLQFLCQLHGRTSDPQVLERALRRMGVFHRRHLPSRALSQGQKKRVALARLVLEQNPGLWVLDEPFDALDDSGAAIVNSLLQEHAQRGGSALLTSHISVKITGVQVRELTLEKPQTK
jgi:heme exporter protein A